MIKPLKSLKDKIEEAKVLEQKLVEVKDEISVLEGDKKVKIKRTSLKKAK